MPTALPAGASIIRLRNLSAQLLFMTCLTVLVGACSGEAGRSTAGATGSDNGQSDPTGPFSVTGYVGNPSLIDAEVKLVASDGSLLASTSSDTSARYSVTLAARPALPFRVEARSGRSLVSGLEGPMTLSAMAFHLTATLSASHLSTLTIRTAECGGVPTAESLARAWSLVAGSFGLSGISEPSARSLSVEETARLMRADSALEEALRRSATALAANSIGVAEIADDIGCDLEDDGLLNLSRDPSAARALLTFLAAGAATTIELIGRQPYVDGQPAAAMLDTALAEVLPEGQRLQGSITDLSISDELANGARRGLAVLIAEMTDPELLDLLLALDAASSLREMVGQRLDATHLNVLRSLPHRIAASDAATIDGLRTRVIGLATASPPIVSFALSENQVAPDETITLSWASAEADRCLAFGAWTGERALQGAYTTPPLTSSASYGLSCFGLGGTTTLAGAVSVATGDQTATPAPAPTLSLSAAPTTVDSGETAEISWTATDASSCQAGDGWSGDRSSSGTEIVGPLSATTTFSLTCTGTGGSVTRTATVTVNSTPAPSVSLTAADPIVDPGATTTLTWTSSNATSCSASGAWNGARPTSGSAEVGPLTARSTFSLSCSGSGGTALAMVAVLVNGSISLSWVAPTENVDGSTLTDLAGYRVYYGETSRAYTGQRQIDDPTATSTAVTLPSGDYFVAMTALDAEGNESAYSNEVLKSTP